MRGVTHARDDLGAGSSGDAEWLALLHALEVAAAAQENDILVLGDSASVIDQANGRARLLASPPVAERFEALCGKFDRLRFRRIGRNQNLAGIALDQLDRRCSQ